MPSAGVKSMVIPKRLPWAQVLPHAGLWLLIVLLFLPVGWTGEFWWTDEARHAMGGVFILDALRDFPIADPMGYALRYFAQYPALALNWYLPGFYAVEAVPFGLFGPSEAVARTVVLGFCLLGVSVWYSWLRGSWGPTVSLLACALLVSGPEWNLWSRSVMLEAPVIAMIIVSVWALQRFMDAPAWPRAVALGVALAGTLLVKQSAAFILPAMLAYVLWSPRRHVLWHRSAWPAYLLLIGAIAVVALHAIKFGSQGLEATVGTVGTGGERGLPLLSLDRWLLYPRTLLETWGLPLLLLSALGALIPRRSHEDRLPLVLAWVVCWYVAVTLMIAGPNAPRYTMYAMPALALLAARPLVLVEDRPKLRAAVIVVLVGALGWNVWRTVEQPVPNVSGYRQAAEQIHATGTRAPMLFAGKHDGNFIFHLRRLDAERRHVVLRADKILLSLAVHKYFGMQSHVGSTADIEALVRRYGIEYVLLESPDVLDLKEFALLGQLVRGPAFEQVASLAVRSGGGAVAPKAIEIYRYRGYVPVEGAEIVIPLPHMGREIRFTPR
jgi:hypothetical protein